MFKNTRQIRFVVKKKVLRPKALDPGAEGWEQREGPQGTPAEPRPDPAAAPGLHLRLKRSHLGLPGPGGDCPGEGHMATQHVPGNAEASWEAVGVRASVHLGRYHGLPGSPSSQATLSIWGLPSPRVGSLHDPSVHPTTAGGFVCICPALRRDVSRSHSNEPGTQGRRVTDPTPPWAPAGLSRPRTPLPGCASDSTSSARPPTRRLTPPWGLCPGSDPPAAPTPHLHPYPARPISISSRGPSPPTLPAL